MKKVIIILTIFLLIFSTGCSVQKKTEKIKVGATIFPLYDLVRNIGGNFIEPVLIVQPGESPHTFSPTIEDLKKLAGAKVIFVNGFGLDEWVEKVARSVNIETEVNVNENLKKIVEEHNGNPHLWLNPKYAVEECKVIADTLSEIDPSHSSYYRKNYEEYTNKILKTAENLKKEVDKLKNKNFIAFHPAYTYFAEYFGMNEVAVIEKVPGQKPTPKELISIENLIKSGKVNVLFKEPQLSSDIVNTIKEDTGIKVETLDPLGGTKGRSSYIKLIIYDVETMKQALNE